MNLTGCVVSMVLLLGAVSPGALGEPLTLDWVDARHSDYLLQIKRRIQEQWDYRCLETQATGACDQLSTQLVVEFAVLTSGEVRYVNVLRSSGDAGYDARAVRAISRAAPYSPAPPDIASEGATSVVVRSVFTHVVRPRMTTQPPRRSPDEPVRQPPPGRLPIMTILCGSLALLAGAALVWLLWRRGEDPAARRMQDDSTAESGGPEVRPSTRPADVVADEALLSMGWHRDGEAATHGLGRSPVNTYSHPDLPRHRVNVSPSGEWEHTTTPGMTARGSTVDDLVRHLGAIHGTLSIADLHLPGRRPG